MTTITTETNFDIVRFIEPYLRSAAHSWSIGIPGAIGEFMYDDSETAEIRLANSAISITTGRGAMAVYAHEDILCVAYEQMSSCTRSWSQNVAFCLPHGKAGLEKHAVLTCLGADQKAINPRAVQMQLYDLGVNSPFLQFCVRSEDEALLAVLQENCGRSIFATGNPVAAAILEHSPARVVRSALGRVEIETEIPRSVADTHAGPHTHLLPALLNAGKTPVADIPTGFVECLALYPEHPAFDKYGAQRQFNQRAHEHFQQLLAELGSTDYLREKRLLTTLHTAESVMDDQATIGSPWQHRARSITRLQSASLAKQ